LAIVDFFAVVVTTFLVMDVYGGQALFAYNLLVFLFGSVLLLAALGALGVLGVTFLVIFCALLNKHVGADRELPVHLPQVREVGVLEGLVAG